MVKWRIDGGGENGSRKAHGDRHRSVQERDSDDLSLGCGRQTESRGRMWATTGASQHVSVEGDGCVECRPPWAS